MSSLMARTPAPAFLHDLAISTTPQPSLIKGNALYEKKSANACCACRNRGKLLIGMFNSKDDGPD
jgi:hypothetical protein